MVLHCYVSVRVLQLYTCTLEYTHHYHDVHTNQRNWCTCRIVDTCACDKKGMFAITTIAFL